MWRSVCICVCMQSVNSVRATIYPLVPQICPLFQPKHLLQSSFFLFVELSEFFSICCILQLLHILMVLKYNKISVLLSKEVHNCIIIAQVKQKHTILILILCM